MLAEQNIELRLTITQTDLVAMLIEFNDLPQDTTLDNFDILPTPDGDILLKGKVKKSGLR